MTTQETDVLFVFVLSILHKHRMVYCISLLEIHNREAKKVVCLLKAASLETNSTESTLTALFAGHRLCLLAR